MLDAWRSGRFVMYPDLPGLDGHAVVAAPRSRLARAHRPAARRGRGHASGRRPPRSSSTTSRPSIPIGGASRSYDQLRRRSRSAEIERLAEFCGVGWDIALDGPLPAVAPHPRLAASRQVDAQRRGARAVLGRGGRGRAASPRRVRGAAPHRARRGGNDRSTSPPRPPPPPPPAPSPPTRKPPIRPSRSRAGTPRRSRKLLEALGYVA